MRPLSLSEVIQLHEYLLEQSGGITGIRDLGALESAVAQPHMTFGGEIYIKQFRKRQAKGFGYHIAWSYYALHLPCCLAVF